MSKKEDHEPKELYDTGADRMQFVRDNRRVDTAQLILEFGRDFGELIVNAAGHDGR